MNIYCSSPHRIPVHDVDVQPVQTPRSHFNLIVPLLDRQGKVEIVAVYEVNYPANICLNSFRGLSANSACVGVIRLDLA